MIRMEIEAKKVFAVAEKYKEIMDILEIPWTDDNIETPMRVAKSLMEMTESTNKHISEITAKCTTFENQSPGIILEQDGIEFSSMCSHHHLPFFGTVKVTYEAGERIIGLSKFNRIVDFFASKPQVQEDMTQEIGMFIVNLMNPKMLKVEIYDCLHSCMCARGVKSRATTRTVFNYHV